MKVLDPGIESLVATKQLCYCFNYAENLKDFFLLLASYFCCMQKSGFISDFSLCQCGFLDEKSQNA